MATVTENIQVIISAENKTGAALNDVGAGFGRLRTVAGGLATAVGTGLVASFGALVAVGKDAVNSANESAAVQKQLEAVLKSTHGAAGLFIEDLNDQAEALQNMTTYSDEAVGSAQAMLLTFTNVKGPIFQESISTILDMSTAMGTDLKGSAIQLGKALNDPIGGISSLSRVGVNFTEDQKQMIETLVKSGKTMEAQKIILNELAVEFGGSASAQAETFEGKMIKLNNAVDGMKETVGNAIITALLPFIEQLTNWVQKDETKELIADITSKFAQFAAPLGPLIAKSLPILINILSILLGVILALGDAFNATANFLGTLIFKVMQAVDWFKKLKDSAGAALDKVKQTLEKIPGASTLGSAVKSAGSSVLNAFNPLAGLLGNLPQFESGGFVNAPVGTAVPAILHGGETVVPVGGAGGGIVINVTGNQLLDNQAGEKIAKKILDVIKYQIKLAV